MAIEVLQGSDAGEAARPALVSWTDRLIALPERLPGPTLAWYLAALAMMPLATHLPAWLTGDIPVGTFDILGIWPAFVVVYCLGVVALLNRIARSSLRQFEPSLGEAPDRHHLAASLTTIPDRQALVTIIVVELVVNVGYLSETGFAQRLFALPDTLRLATLIAFWIAAIGIAVLILHTVRQLRIVSQLHAVATSIDLFEPGAINAFSRLTAATAVAILVFALPFVGQGDPIDPQASAFGLLLGLSLVFLAVASFVLPLNGLHQRLAAEKDLLVRATNSRLKAALARFHAAVDSDDHERAGQLQQTISSLVSEGDLLNKLSTWPWSAGTFRGFASALLLPVAIFLITRYLDRLV